MSQTQLTAHDSTRVAEAASQWNELGTGRATRAAHVVRRSGGPTGDGP